MTMRLVRSCWLFAAIWLPACGGSVDAGPAPADPASVAAPTGPHTVVVFATASLRAPFEALARRYERDHPGARVELHVDGGARLLARTNADEPVDVLAIGDSSLMSRFAAAAHLASHNAAELARSRVAIAVAAGNPKNVLGLRDLARPDVRVALGARTSSIGRYSRWVLSRLDLDLEPAAEGDSADAVLAKVTSGEADATIVYTTSLRGADGVTAVTIPEGDNTPVLYSISATRKATEPRGAAAFRNLALGPDGQAILREHGFLPIGAKE
jgi:molybdate transport system substrate-binding protein